MKPHNTSDNALEYDDLEYDALLEYDGDCVNGDWYCDDGALEHDALENDALLDCNGDGYNGECYNVGCRGG